MNNLITQFPKGMPVHHPYHGNGTVIGHYEVGDSGPYLIVQFFTQNGRDNLKLVIRKTELSPDPPVRRRRSRSRSRSGNRNREGTRRRSGRRG